MLRKALVVIYPKPPIEAINAGRKSQYDWPDYKEIQTVLHKYHENAEDPVSGGALWLVVGEAESVEAFVQDQDGVDTYGASRVELLDVSRLSEFADGGPRNWASGESAVDVAHWQDTWNQLDMEALVP